MEFKAKEIAEILGGTVDGNPEAVAVLKEQIVALRDSIDARQARCGKEYWSNYTLEVISYEADE